MRQFLFCALLIVLVFCFFGCKNDVSSDIEENTTAAQTTTNDDDAEKPVTLESVCGADTIDFDADYVEIAVYSDLDYRFSDRNEDFCLSLTEFLKNTKFNSVLTDKAEDGNYYFVSIFENKNHASFSVYDTDVICVVDVYDRNLYYCEGVYDSFEKTFGTYFEENSKYYSIKPIYDRSTYDHPVLIEETYSVFDKNNNVLESDSTTETPHLFYDSGIVHLWFQTGTGIMTRFAKFYDVENGKTSPEYYGQTDWFSNMVSSTGHSQVIIYDMFSGDELYRINEFEKPLGDCIENIQSAFFSTDGKQLIVKYLNEDFEQVTQTFDLPDYVYRKV